MEAPLLKLTVQKGPSEGEIIEGKPGAKSVRIGRVVKGNTFSIKDPGISSKHLLIEFKDGKWLLSDLGSSNGTFLNGKLINANVGVGLKDGDLIKIGELTSIGVSVSGEKENEEVEEVELKNEEVEEVELKPKPRRGRLRKDEKVAAVEAPVPPEVEKGKSVDLENGVGRGRRNLRRGAKAKEEQQEVLPAAVKEDVGSLVEKPGRQVGRRGVKSSKTVQFVGVPENEVAHSSQAEPSHGEQEEALPPEKESVDFVAQKRGRGRPRGTKNSKNVRCENLAVGVSEMNIVDEDKLMRSSQGESSHGEQDEALPPEKESLDFVVEKRGRQVGRRATKNSKNVRSENLAVGVSEMDNVDEDEIMKTSQSEPSQSGQLVDAEAPEVQEELNLKKETRDELNDSTGINEASEKAEKIASMKMTLDQLQKMTLGEWFDFMEVYLVKKIYEETDEIIAGMQSRAEQFEKFMSEQESLKNKSPLF